ncbi:MAG: FAD:protein FMN transferase [Dokdonella sp.]
MNAKHSIRRSRPWLGTFVDIRVDGLADDRAISVIEAAFAEVAAVHRLMSFHEATSDLSRLHRDAVRKPVTVDACTYEVLQAALRFAEESQGFFDPTIAARMVEWKRLPRPLAAASPDPLANWRDIQLLADARVCFKRPLWLDLGGIAKGYAVDRALAILRASGASAACVNAGGDLRRFGVASEQVELRLSWEAGQAAAVVEIGDAAIASSVVDSRRDDVAQRMRSSHVNARDGRSVRALRAVSVVADSCLVADALTKVVLADARVGQRMLRRHAASALLVDGARGHRLLNDS